MPKKNDTELDAPVELPPTSTPKPLELEPHEWAAKLGNIVKGDERLPQSKTFPNMQHACADKLHGWSQHRHHYQTEPLKLTQADYEAALKAAGEYPSTPAHEPALSPVSPVRKQKVK